MKLIDGEKPDVEGRHLIYFTVWDRDVFSFARSVNAPVNETTIDEIEANKALCLDLAGTHRKEDSDGDRKYYIDADDDIIEKEGWVQYYADEI